MAQIIDALLVTVGLDASKFKQGEKETEDSQRRLRTEAEKTAKDFEFRGKQAASFFTQIRKEVAGVLAALLGTRAIAGFTAKFAEGNQALGQTAANIGITAEELSTFQIALERFGGTAADATADLARLQKLAIQWKFNPESIPKELLAAFGRLNIDGAEYLSRAIPLREKILGIAGAFQQLDRAEASYFATDQLGFSQNFANALLLNGPKAANDLLNASAKFAHTAADTKAGDELKGIWWEIEHTIDKAATTLLTKFTPEIKAAFEEAKKVGKEIEAWLKQFTEIKGLMDRLRSINERYQAAKNNEQSQNPLLVARATADNLYTFGKIVTEELGPHPSNVLWPEKWTAGHRAGGPIGGLGEQAAPAATEAPNKPPPYEYPPVTTSAVLDNYNRGTDFLDVLRRSLGIIQSGALQGSGGPITNVTNVAAINLTGPYGDTQVFVRDMRTEIQRAGLASQADAGTRR